MNGGKALLIERNNVTKRTLAMVFLFLFSFVHFKEHGEEIMVLLSSSSVCFSCAEDTFFEEVEMGTIKIFKKMLKLQFILFIGVGATFYSFIRQRTHFLTALLALEVVVTFIIAILMLISLDLGVRAERLVFMLLTIGVCEARLGLSLLVAIVRAYGRDLISSLTLHQV